MLSHFVWVTFAGMAPGFVALELFKSINQLITPPPKKNPQKQNQTLESLWMVQKSKDTKGCVRKGKSFSHLVS